MFTVWQNVPPEFEMVVKQVVAVQEDDVPLRVAHNAFRFDVTLNANELAAVTTNANVPKIIFLFFISFSLFNLR